LRPEHLLPVQVERNLQDAMGVARNVCFDPRLVPGGGAVEMAVSRSLTESASKVKVGLDLSLLQHLWAAWVDCFFYSTRRIWRDILLDVKYLCIRVPPQAKSLHNSVEESMQVLVC